MSNQIPNPLNFPSVSAWASRLFDYLTAEATETGLAVAAPVLLARLSADARASVDGIVLFDPVNKVPVYSANGAYVPIPAASELRTVTAAYNIDGSPYTAGDTALLSGTLAEGVYRLSGFVTVVTTGSAENSVVFYIADSADLTTPVSSAISGSITLPAVATLTVQVPISGDLTVGPGGLSYSVVARTAGSALYSGKAHGVAGLDNLYAAVSISKVQQC